MKCCRTLQILIGVIHRLLIAILAVWLVSLSTDLAAADATEDSASPSDRFDRQPATRAPYIQTMNGPFLGFKVFTGYLGHSHTGLPGAEVPVGSAVVFGYSFLETDFGYTYYFSDGLGSVGYNLGVNVIVHPFRRIDLVFLSGYEFGIINPEQNSGIELTYFRLFAGAGLRYFISAPDVYLLAEVKYGFGTYGSRLNTIKFNNDSLLFRFGVGLQAEW